MDISMLKEYLGEALYAQAEEKLGAVGDLQVIAAHDGTWLPRSRLDAEIAKRRELQGTVDSLTEALNEANRKLEAEGELQGQVERLSRELARRERSGALREALTRARARDVDLVEKLLAAEESESGPEEQVAALRKRSPYLFDEAGGVRGGFGSPRREDLGAHGDVNGAIRAAAGRY